MRARDRSAGFTFMEILLVLTILLVLLAVSVPKLSGSYRRAQALGAARDLTAALHYARHFAVLSGVGCQIKFDPNNATYEVTPVEIDANGEPGDEIDTRRFNERGDRGTLVRIAGDFVGARRLPDNVFFSLVHSSAPTTDRRGLPRIVFYPDGSATSGKIGVQSRGGKAYRIDVYRTTGMAKVEEGQPVIERDLQPLFYEPEYVLFKVIG
jgi:Tfp pilus assembly protein FimT